MPKLTFIAKNIDREGTGIIEQVLNEQGPLQLLRSRFKMVNLRKNWLLLIALIFPMYYPVTNLIAGSIAHWHDSAWALLIGLENHHKISLIGYEGGLPAVHYGPHWFWLVAAVQLFNKNPAIVATFLLFIPYFVIFPALLYKFRIIFPKFVVIILWLVFILASHHNILNLWQINLTPIIFLALIYILITLDFEKRTFLEFSKFFLAGILASLLVNTNGVLGFILSLSTIVYLFGYSAISYIKSHNLTKTVIITSRSFLLFTVGFLFSHLPYILFEIRHDFIQTKAIANIFIQSFVYNTAVVGQPGLSNSQIWETFLTAPLILLQLPHTLRILWWTILAILAVYLIKKGPKLSLYEKRLLAILSICSTLIIAAFLTSKNPIWTYHFIGVEIIFLLLIGFLANKIRLVFIFLVIWTTWLSANYLISTVADKPANPLSTDTLAAKRYIVESIYQDAKVAPFATFAYAPSIYTFDYDYLFKWLGGDKYKYEPTQNSNPDTVYLIIPSTDDGIKLDFINYKTPNNRYQTANQWLFPNKTTVVKRVKN